jgi:hypothetical protein
MLGGAVVSIEFGEAVEKVLAAALEVLAAERVPIHTIALYFDHESPALSVCVDTKDNSSIHVARQNAYSMRYFRKAISSGNLDDARLWQANVGRNFSLGDFSRVNLGRFDLAGMVLSDVASLAMVEALLKRQDEIAKHAPNPDELVFCCSTANDEVGLVWSYGTASAK